MTFDSMSLETSIINSLRFSGILISLGRFHDVTQTPQNRSTMPTFAYQLAITPEINTWPPSLTLAVTCFASSPNTASRAPYANFPPIIYFTWASAFSSLVDMTSSAPKAFNSSFCSLQWTRFMVLIPQCLAS